MSVKLIYDGNNLAYRCNCMTELYTRTGERTSAIIGVLNSIHSNIGEINDITSDKVNEVVVAWDTGHSPRRTELYPEYKANRKKNQDDASKEWMYEFIMQANTLHENLPLFGIKSYRKKNWEGDDIIYAFSEELHKRNPDDQIVVVSTDEDFHQLVSEYVSIYSPIKQVLYTNDNYEELTGIKPELFLTYKIMKGDSSDGIPGIDGIGEKIGKSLVNKYGSLDKMFLPEAREELMKSKRTARIFTPEGLKTLDRNNQLINLKDYVDYDEIKSDIEKVLSEESRVDIKGTQKFLMKYQLTSILTKHERWIQEFQNLSE